MESTCQRDAGLSTLQLREAISQPVSPKRKFRRHTLASSAAAATRELRFDNTMLPSPTASRMAGPPLVPPKSPHRIQSSVRRSEQNPIILSTDTLIDVRREEDDLSLIIKDLLSDMDASLLYSDSPVDDASSMLSGVSTLCERQNYPLTIRPSVSRSQTSSTKSSGSRRIPKTKTPEDYPSVDPGQINNKNVSKVWHYSNSRLPDYLPSLKVHTTAWPLLTLAAQFSKRAYRVYDKGELQMSKEQIVLPTTQKTKPAILQSVVVDDVNVIVLAIRGTAGFRDWIVNTDHLPASPGDFLDDPANFCHSGFLRAGRTMAKTVATRLKALLDSRRSDTPVSLLLTGHSAGGAIAQLLYSHMLATTTNSPLKDLLSSFERIHCITFGAPPLSLRPLRKPLSLAYRESLFIAFANEGDIVVRSDKRVFKSLIRLYLSPVPQAVIEPRPAPRQHRSNWFWQCLGFRRLDRLDQLKIDEKTPSRSPHDSMNRTSSPARWKIPPSTLSLAGSVVLLREKDTEDFGFQQVEACQVSSDLLQGFVFGDPSCHSMGLYLERVESLAKEAVTNAYLHNHLF